MGVKPRSAGERAVAGMDARAPLGAEAVGDFSQDHRGADFALRDVVGRRHAAVGQEDEEFAPPGLDLRLQGAAIGMGGGRTEQRVEATVRFRKILGERGVAQRSSSLADPDRPAQQIADLRGEDGIAAIDGVLHIAQDVGETDRVRPARSCWPA